MCLSAIIRNYRYVLAVIFFHHRDTGGTENLLHLPAGRRAICKKICLCALCDSLVRPDSSKLQKYVTAFMKPCTKEWIFSGGSENHKMVLLP
jgi:hypothetical protein